MSILAQIGQPSEPYRGWETACLAEHLDLRGLMAHTIRTAQARLRDPEADILHARICAALAYDLARHLPAGARRLVVAAALLHDNAKGDAEAPLTDPEVFRRTRDAITYLKAAGHFADSPVFWKDEAALRHPGVGGDRTLIHHLTGVPGADRILHELGGFSEAEIRSVQAAVAAHSTGYWYFRESVDRIVDRPMAWQEIYPVPGGDIARIVHDADLVSQLALDMVLPEGSKWRSLARTRWRAGTGREEGHILYYVFWRFFREVESREGMALLCEQWEQIRPALLTLMGLGADRDPLETLGVPMAFRGTLLSA